MFCLVVEGCERVPRACRHDGPPQEGNPTQELEREGVRTNQAPDPFRGQWPGLE